MNLADTKTATLESPKSHNPAVDLKRRRRQRQDLADARARPGQRQSEQRLVGIERRHRAERALSLRQGQIYPAAVDCVEADGLLPIGRSLADAFSATVLSVMLQGSYL